MAYSFRSQLVLLLRLSIVLAALGAIVKGAQAHELRPAIADVTVSSDSVVLRIELALEALVAEVDVSEVDNTDEAPNAEAYDAYRLMEPGALEAALREAWADLAAEFMIAAGETALRAEIAEVVIPEVGNVELVRDSMLTLGAALPDDGSAVAVGWAARNGPLVVRQDGMGDDGYAALLQGGELSKPLARQGGGGVLRFLFGE
jgi:hypothetical protein